MPDLSMSVRVSEMQTSMGHIRCVALLLFSSVQYLLDTISSLKYIVQLYISLAAVWSVVLGLHEIFMQHAQISPRHRIWEDQFRDLRVHAPSRAGAVRTCTGMGIIFNAERTVGRMASRSWFAKICVSNEFNSGQKRPHPDTSILLA